MLLAMVGRAAAVAAAALGRMVFESTHDGSPADIQQGPRGFMAENPRVGEASRPGPMTNHRTDKDSQLPAAL